MFFARRTDERPGVQRRQVRDPGAVSWSRTSSVPEIFDSLPKIPNLNDNSVSRLGDDVDLLERLS